MAGPRDIIRRASIQHRRAESVPGERLPAPAPMQAGKTSFSQPDPEASASRTAGWRMPPLMQTGGKTMDAPDAERHGTEQADMPASERRPVAQNMGSHAIYSGLMRSHDRMGTRHIRPGG